MEELVVDVVYQAVFVKHRTLMLNQEAVKQLKIL